MKKSNIFRLIFVIGFAILLVILTVSVKDPNEKIMVDKISDYVVELPTYTKIEDDIAIKYMADRFDGWNNKTKEELPIKGGCTSSAKVLSNGDMIVSRNMDLTLSNSPVYVFYINEEGRYKSFNIAYIDGLGGDYEDIITDGLDKKYYDVIPYLVTDSMNEYGFSIEMNMRNAEYDMEGNLILAASSTNKDSKTRISSMSLVRYLSDHAKNVNEALKIIGAINYETKESYGNAEIDIYSMNSENSSNSLAYQIADASGNFGIIEIANNNVYFHPKASIQANYFLTDEFYQEEKFGSGNSRVKAVEKDFDSIDSIYGMMANMSKVRYSKTYSLNNEDFISKEEYVGLNVCNAIRIINEDAKTYNFNVPDYSYLTQTVYDVDSKNIVVVTPSTCNNYKNIQSIWTEKFISNPENTEVDAFAKWFAQVYLSLTDKQRRDMKLFWNTIHHITYNNTQKYAIVTFFEDDSTTRVFDFKKFN